MRRTDVDVKGLVEQIAKAIVDHPDQVELKAVESQGTTLLELRVASGEAGQAIGSKGGLADSIREILDQVGDKLDHRFNFHVINSRR